MTEPEFFVPVLVLALSFCYKAFVDQVTNLAGVILVVLSLPFDIHFLGLSFVSAYTIAHGSDKGLGTIYILGYAILAFIVTFIWRRSNRYFDEDAILKSILLCTLNIVISILTPCEAGHFDKVEGVEPFSTI